MSAPLHRTAGRRQRQAQLCSFHISFFFSNKSLLTHPQAALPGGGQPECSRRSRTATGTVHQPCSSRMGARRCGERGAVSRILGARQGWQPGGVGARQAGNARPQELSTETNNKNPAKPPKIEQSQGAGGSSWGRRGLALTGSFYPATETLATNSSGSSPAAWQLCRAASRCTSATCCRAARMAPSQQPGLQGNFSHLLGV